MARDGFRTTGGGRADSRIILEGRTVIHQDLVLTDEDRKFAEELARQEIVVIDELKQGVRIAAKWSWVGVVQFSNFELQIRPKLSSRGEPGEDLLALAEMLDFISDTQELRVFRKRLRRFDGAGTNLFELMIGTFADACEEIVLRGVLSDYEVVEEQLGVLRGRMLLRKQFERGFGRFDKIECEHDEHTTDIRENKLLLVALKACLGRVRSSGGGGGGGLSAQLERLVRTFEDAASVDGGGFDFDEAHKEQVGAYNRLNRYYQHAHGLAALIMAGLSHRTVFSGGKQKCFSFVFKMYEVFEKFVFKILMMQLSELNYRVHYQRSDSEILWNTGMNRSYASLRPDFLIENLARPGVFLPVDAKYKNYDERGLDVDDTGDEFARKISTQDIYQTFAYAHGFGHGQHAVVPTSIIFYPSSIEDSGVKRIQVRRRLDGTASGVVIVVPVNIRRALDNAIKRQAPAAMNSEVVSAIRESLTAIANIG